MLTLRRRILTAAIAAACLGSLAVFPSANPARAQSDCASLTKQRDEIANHLNSYTIVALKKTKAEQAAMQTTDSRVADKHLAEALKGLAIARREYGEDSGIAKIYQDQVDFWQSKRSELALGMSVGGKDAYVQLMDNNLSKLQKRESTERAQIAQMNRQIAQCQGGNPGAGESRCSSIVGTWHWWNGLTATFAAGGGASYRGETSGSGIWQKTGGNSYHAHWNGGNTDDYFTMSADGTKIEGTFDGKPGVSTRRC